MILSQFILKGFGFWKFEKKIRKKISIFKKFHISPGNDAGKYFLSIKMLKKCHQEISWWQIVRYIFKFFLVNFVFILIIQKNQISAKKVVDVSKSSYFVKK